MSRGAWAKYVSRDPDEEVKGLILRALEAGHTDNLLISHDVGWYDPAKPGGGSQRPYTHMSDVMMALLRHAGVDEGTLKRLTEDNPLHAYARDARGLDRCRNRETITLAVFQIETGASRLDGLTVGKRP